MGNKVLIYNQNNQLIRVEEDNLVLGDYTYNGLGQRMIKTVDGITTIFHYDLNGKLIAESLPDGTMTTEYLYMGKIRIAKVDVTTGNTYYYLNDRLGTPQLMTDDTGTIVWEASYRPFGEATVNSRSTEVNHFRLPGQYFDEETGLHYNYFRYYDPGTGRYVRGDPSHLLQPEGKDIPHLFPILLNRFQEFNLYQYAENSPINWVDPLGLARGDWWDPRTYVAVSFSTSFLGMGHTISKRLEQKTITFFDLGGASIDIQIGWLPSVSDITSEIGFGLGKYLSIGYFFGRPDAFGSMEVGGIVFHFGLGVGSPAYISGTFPEDVDPCNL
jgi:RHS repeat-associated protein